MSNTPPEDSAKIERVSANEETTVLEPIIDAEPIVDAETIVDGVSISDGEPLVKRVSPIEGESVVDTDEEVALRPASRRWIWIAATSILAALLIGVIVLAVQLRDRSLEWEAQVSAVTAQNYDLGTSLSAEQTQVVDLQSANDQITSQLQTAQEKILALADEKAQQGDNVEFYARQIDDLTTQLTNAANVANALDRCIDGEEQLVGYLKAPENYDPIEVSEFEASLKVKCDNAVASNVELQRILAQ